MQPAVDLPAEVTIEPEDPPRDAAPIEALYDATFGPGHFAKTAERLREFNASLPELSRVARSQGRIIAVCRVWPINVTGEAALFYGPVAVAPDRRGKLLGLDVTREALEAGRAEGWPFAVLIGALSYFGRLGFERVEAGSLVLPGPQDPSRVLVCRFDGRAPTPGDVAPGHGARC
ncbi:MAG: N-acetyltransferase [Pseudomonadota bacterium]